MKPRQSSMKVAEDFKKFIKRAVVNHAYAKKLEEPVSQVDMQLRLVRFLKLNASFYTEFINMEDKNA